MENTEKRAIELEPQTIESANNISSDIMDAAKKMFGSMTGIIHLQDFFLIDHSDCFFTGCQRYFYLSSIIFFVWIRKLVRN